MNKILILLFSPLFIIKIYIERSKLFSKIRVSAYRILGAKLCRSVTMQSNVRLYGIKNIDIDANTFLGSGVRIVTYDAKVNIGKNVLIASDCIILTRNHEYSRVDIPIKMQGYMNKDIVIGDDVWLGYRVVILPGVTIGKGAIIATNSVVNKNIPEYTVYGGSPAKYIKSRRGDEDIPYM